MAINRLFPGSLVVLVGLAGAAAARAQSMTEYGTMTSSAGATVTASKVTPPKVNVPSTPTAASTPSPHMPITNPAAIAASNRANLEKQAGPNGGKVSLRSTPDIVPVWVDTEYVGMTPLDIKLAPGRHRIYMQSSTTEAGQQDLDLQPGQAQQVVLTLKPRYRSEVKVQWAKPN